MNLYPELMRMKKRVVIGSYSFGDPDRIQGNSEVFFQHQKALVKKVTAQSEGDWHYAPEINICAFLDEKFPESAPHFIYAYYARSFTVSLLSKLYLKFIDEHSIDAFVIIDGGSDSLMRGNEAGLGDPLEDAVSVATVALLPGIKLKILLTIGLGCDRFNTVSDASSFRAIAELTRDGGFMGCFSIEPDSFSDQFLQEASELQLKESLFLWPLMAIFWAFDPVAVARRSLTIQWIQDSETVADMQKSFFHNRASIKVLPVEHLPAVAGDTHTTTPPEPSTTTIYKYTHTVLLVALLLLGVTLGHLVHKIKLQV
ncbi:cell surface glycoprotein [Pelomyxa schiedti]|nr:cell surface glycoprotein [Pelomyxa schiedti]